MSNLPCKAMAHSHKSTQQGAPSDTQIIHFWARSHMHQHMMSYPCHIDFSVDDMTSWPKKGFPWPVHCIYDEPRWLMWYNQISISSVQNRWFSNNSEVTSIYYVWSAGHLLGHLKRDLQMDKSQKSSPAAAATVCSSTSWCPPIPTFF